MSALPFPHKMKRKQFDKCFGRFLEMLKKLYVNIPFTEVLTQMPAYAKFLKEILSRKRKLEETIVVKLNAHCSAILQNKIPQKKLQGELGVIKSIPVSLQLVDHTTIFPEGIIEDILVQVDKFVFLVDFIVVDLEVNKEVPFILGRPFLCTGRAILDIYEGQLMLRVGSEKVIFQINRIMKYPVTRRSPTRVSSWMWLKNWLKITNTQERQLVELLKKHKKAISWSIPDIQGISPVICMHKIMLEENSKPVLQPQRKLNKNLEEVVHKEIIKLLDARVILPSLIASGLVQYKLYLIRAA
uniref:Uncharacterized protein n=1 Tax=Nicotiana tabacum TaxID=4097 RepID=A0A1S4CGP2_TOBAC|nr:PREDICTED: uncharacterized protein LOC107818809 [Nicotiana tabacum]